jgi:hypothetical protein
LMRRSNLPVFGKEIASHPSTPQQKNLLRAGRA